MNLSVLANSGAYCVNPAAGARLAAEIAAALGRSEPVCLDFAGVKVLTARFLVAAVGSLYGLFPSRDLEEQLAFAGLDLIDTDLLRAVQAKARTFYAASPELRARLAEADRQLIAND